MKQISNIEPNLPKKHPFLYHSSTFITGIPTELDHQVTAMSIARRPRANPLDVLLGRKDTLNNMCKTTPTKLPQNSPCSNRRRIETDGPEIVDSMVTTAACSLGGDAWSESQTRRPVPMTTELRATFPEPSMCHCDTYAGYAEVASGYSDRCDTWSYIPYTSLQGDDSVPSHHQCHICDAAYQSGQLHHAPALNDNYHHTDFPSWRTQDDHRPHVPAVELPCERPGCGKPTMTNSSICYDHYANDLYFEITLSQQGPPRNLTYDIEEYFQHERPSLNQSVT